MENKRYRISFGRRIFPALIFFLPLLTVLAGPVPVCDEPVYNFGRIGPSATVTNVFVIRNEGDITFVAGTIRTGCGCTQARISKRMVGPGETADLTVVFSAVRRQGPQKKAIYLQSADSGTPALVFYMEGFVESSAGSD